MKVGRPSFHLKARWISYDFNDTYTLHYPLDRSGNIMNKAGFFISSRKLKTEHEAEKEIKSMTEPVAKPFLFQCDNIINDNRTTEDIKEELCFNDFCMDLDVLDTLDMNSFCDDETVLMDNQ